MKGKTARFGLGANVTTAPVKIAVHYSFRYPRYQDYLLAKLSNLTINYSSGLVPTGNLPLWGTQTNPGSAGSTACATKTK